MKFYIKVFKDGKQVFEGWNDKQDYITFFKKAFNNDYLEDYNVSLEDYSSNSNCGSYLFDEFKETTLDVFDNLIELIDGLETAEDFYNTLDDTSDIFYSEYYSFDEETINEIFQNPYEALRACFFGEVNFNDDLFTFNGYGNIVTVNEIPFDDYADSIIKQWIYENL